MNPIVWVILASIACSVGGQLSLKGGMNRVGRLGRGHSGNWRHGLPRLLTGLSFYGVSTLLWLYTLSRVDLSFAFPFLSLSFVAILFGARLGLGESLARTRVAGSVLIVAGVFVVSLSQPDEIPTASGLGWTDEGRPALLLLDEASPTRLPAARWNDLLVHSFGACDRQPLQRLFDAPESILEGRRVVVLPHSVLSGFDAAKVEWLEPWIRAFAVTVVIEAPEEDLAAALGLRIARVEKRAYTPWPYDAQTAFLQGPGLAPPAARIPLPWPVWRYAPAAGARPLIRPTATIAGRPATWTRAVDDGAWMVLNVDLAAWIESALAPTGPPGVVLRAEAAPWLDAFAATIFRPEAAAAPWPRLDALPTLSMGAGFEIVDSLAVDRGSALPWRSRDRRGELRGPWRLATASSVSRGRWNEFGSRGPLAFPSTTEGAWARSDFDAWWHRRSARRWTWSWQDPWLTLRIEEADSTGTTMTWTLPRSWQRRPLADWSVEGTSARSARGWLFSEEVLRVELGPDAATLRVQYPRP